MASLMFGVAVLELGLLALTGLRSEILIAVAFLSFGAYLFLKGVATVGHLFWWNRSETTMYKSQA
jgi:uncharacterized membrane protein HdeD (DUF308 family)